MNSFLGVEGRGDKLVLEPSDAGDKLAGFCKSLGVTSGFSFSLGAVMLPAAGKLRHLRSDPDILRSTG